LGVEVAVDFTGQSFRGEEFLADVERLVCEADSFGPHGVFRGFDRRNKRTGWVAKSAAVKNFISRNSQGFFIARAVFAGLWGGVC
jgi:hypothetical protein